jgi:phosphate-selective porin OprO/OprP
MKKSLHYLTIGAMLIALFSGSKTFGNELFSTDWKSETKITRGQTSDTRHSWSTPKLGGRLHLDSFAINQPESEKVPTDLDNKAGLRELRLTITGTGYESFDYKVELLPFDADGRIGIFDTWIGAKNVPGLGYFRVGHYNVETGLMYMGGSAQTTLTDFSPATLSFNLGRKFGCSSDLLFANNRIRWFNGFFQGKSINTSRSVQDDDQGFIYNTRLTFVPYYSDSGRYMLHVGGHYSYIDETSSYQKVSTFVGGNSFITGGPNNANPITTGANDVTHHHRGGLELAYQAGPFRALTEAFAADYGNVGTATGTVVELTYFLTGEHRAYSLENGVFGGPTKLNRPFHPFPYGDWNLVDGLGAWQLVTRYNYTDLNDWRGVQSDFNGDPVRGGVQHDLTFGVNWYWTPNLR